MALSDDTIWAALEDRHRATGWADRVLLIDATVIALTASAACKSRREADRITGRLNALWKYRAADMLGTGRSA